MIENEYQVTISGKALRGLDRAAAIQGKDRSVAIGQAIAVYIEVVDAIARGGEVVIHPLDGKPRTKLVIE